ncbi:DUF4363 family protein [Desertibacillus haloalkaliphilus]|uniref:DUF4363 family protein n=1 Tax=Desertibacillus haloalkaliphilus TaxID=1328930 RepID=UPI001C26095C|nr:DUF4363 family protein [Desertibacillus haloalkaliphilus]MBU8906876.1 DUF4363 family protein [Desertibacillus haloalkaliphilus]
MKRRLLVYGFPVLIIALSVVVMTSGKVVKHPLKEDDHFIEQVKQVHTNVTEKQWGKAEDSIKQAIDTYDSIVNRVQFSVERELIYDIHVSLARIHGCIVTRDDTSAIQEIYVLYELWKHLGKG